METYLWTFVLFGVLETLKKKKGVLETKEGQANYLGQAGEKGEVFVDLQKKKTNKSRNFKCNFSLNNSFIYWALYVANGIPKKTLALLRKYPNPEWQAHSH